MGGLASYRESPVIHMIRNPHLFTTWKFKGLLGAKWCCFGSDTTIGDPRLCQLLGIPIYATFGKFKVPLGAKCGYFGW